MHFCTLRKHLVTEHFKPKYKQARNANGRKKKKKNITLKLADRKKWDFSKHVTFMPICDHSRSVEVKLFFFFLFGWTHFFSRCCQNPKKRTTKKKTESRDEQQKKKRIAQTKQNKNRYYHQDMKCHRHTEREIERKSRNAPAKIGDNLWRE